jgi:demethylmenaquinone methyltransferase/2-methoxy-6-polyprenyl-1,4-benzoquinol methylase
MFGRIAGRYDLLNTILSLGLHRRWKRQAAAACRLPPGGLLLDVCAGTADIAIAVGRLGGGAVALDFSRPMLDIGRRKARGLRVMFAEGDALSLPFRGDMFDAAAIGFSLRNLSAPGGDLAAVLRALREMARVVRTNGWVVALETSQPRARVARAAYHQYVRGAVAFAPLLSERAAYQHLLKTVVAFPGAEEVADLFRTAGLVDVSYTRMLLGAAALHVGRVG